MIRRTSATALPEDLALLANLLTVSQAAERLGVCERTIRRHVERGTLPAVRLGRLIRVDARALEPRATPTAKPPAPAVRSSVHSRGVRQPSR